MELGDFVVLSDQVLVDTLLIASAGSVDFALQTVDFVLEGLFFVEESIDLEGLIPDLGLVVPALDHANHAVLLPQFQVLLAQLLLQLLVGHLQMVHLFLQSQDHRVV